MPRSPKRLILVTGAPRSGTTAVGDVLAAAPAARELYEPFNRHAGMREIDHDFPVPGSPRLSLEEFAGLVERIRRIDLDLRPGILPHDAGWRRVTKRVTGSRTTMTTRLARVAPRLDTVIWKDPFAIYAAGAARDLDIPVVVTVRDPWATAASFKRLGWGFEVAPLVDSLRRAGRPVSLDPNTLNDPADPVVNAAAHWRLVHESVLGELREGGIHLLDLDAVVERPVSAFRGLYRLVGLEWTGKVEEAVLESYAPNAATPTVGRFDVEHRDLATDRPPTLEPDEVEVVERLCEPIWAAVQERFAIV